MSSCSACAERRAAITSNPDTALLPLCYDHQQAQKRGRPRIAATVSPEAHRELKAMAKDDGLSMSRCVDLMIRAEWRRRQRPPGWGN